MVQGSATEENRPERRTLYAHIYRARFVQSRLRLDTCRNRGALDELGSASAVHGSRPPPDRVWPGLAPSSMSARRSHFCSVIG